MLCGKFGNYVNRELDGYGVYEWDYDNQKDLNRILRMPDNHCYSLSPDKPNNQNVRHFLLLYASRRRKN